MSSRVDLKEFLPPYLVEVEELLTVARAHLLAVEAAARTGGSSPRLVRELFRALHTIKGLSAMVDVEPVVALSHLMEAILRQADNRGGRLASGSVEPLLEGLQVIEARVRALGDGAPVVDAPAPLLQQLEDLEANDGRAVAAPPRGLSLSLEPALEKKLSATEREQLLQGVAGGLRAVRLDFAPSESRAAAGFTINAVRERVSKLAELVKVLPLTRPSPEAPAGGLVFALLLLTGAPDAELAAAAGVEPSSLQRVASPEVAALDEGAPVSAEPSPVDGEESLVSRRHNVVRVEPGRLDEAMERLSAMVVSRSRLARAVARLGEAGANTRELVQLLQENGRELKHLRTAIVQLRMVKVSEVLDRLPLIVRGLRRATGKSVRLELDVEGPELDKVVGDRLFPAIVHLVRNAVDHALEPAAARLAAGKPAEGVVRVRCNGRSNARLELQVSDDGSGIDAEAVARTAGAPVPERAPELLDLLCRPGLSTRGEVTTTSGRGMGMDIVRRITVEELGGELRLETARGQGTTFTLIVPLTLSIVDAFIFECASQRYAVVVSSVEELFEIDPARVVRGPPGSGGAVEVGLIERRGAAVPLLPLAKLLRLEGASEGRKALVVRDRGEPIAFAVDRVMGQQEIVIRTLEDPLVRVRGVAGATDLGDGKPTLVLDLAALGTSRKGQEQAR